MNKSVEHLTNHIFILFYFYPYGTLLLYYHIFAMMNVRAQKAFIIGILFYHIIFYCIISLSYQNQHKHLKLTSQVVETFIYFIIWLHTLCSLYYYIIVPMEQKLSILSFYYTVSPPFQNRS